MGIKSNDLNDSRLLEPELSQFPLAIVDANRSLQGFSPNKSTLCISNGPLNALECMA